MKKVISVTRKDRDFLMKAFDVSSQMVSYALNFAKPQGESDLAKKIRRLAMQRGGFVMVCAPASEVVHDHEGVMRQYFENGWMWEGNTHTGSLVVKNAQGDVVSWIEHATIKDIEAVQASMGKASAKAKEA